MKKLLSIALVVAGFTISATAENVDFTYNVDHKTSKVYGFKKKETYDVAIKIDDPALIGAMVTGLEVTLPIETSDATNLSGWLASELQIKDNANYANLTNADATLQDSRFYVTFDEPQEISPEGIWVGYSFTVTSLDGYGNPGTPIAVIESKKNLDKGLWVHSSRTKLKWINLAESIQAVSTMTVHLQTDFGPNDASVSIPANSYFKIGETASIPATIINHGRSDIEEIEYTYTFGETSKSGSLTLETPIPMGGKTAVVSIPVEPGETLGAFPLKITIDKCNGGENTDKLRTAEGTLNVWNMLPIANPLVEEYTGLGCGYCPRGYVAMEEMPNFYGDRFIGLAYHSEDYESGCMVVMPNKDFPFEVPGFPYGTINRSTGMDPSAFPSRWPSFAEEIAPAEIDVTLDWDNDSKTRVVAKTNVTFAGNLDNINYRIAVALVADGLKNDDWKQNNYFAGKEPVGVASDLWKIFTDGAAKVSGLTFNDVVAYFKEVKGIEGSVPSKVNAGQTITLDYPVNLGEVTNVKKEIFINPGATLHAVAILLDANTGYSLNCNKSNSLTPDYTGIDNIKTDDTIESVNYYDLNGIQISHPSCGIFIERTTYSDGTVSTRKIVR